MIEQSSIAAGNLSLKKNKMLELNFKTLPFWGSTTVPKYNSAENEKLINSAEN